MATDDFATCGHTGHMQTRFREILEFRHIKPADLARRSNADPTTINKLVNGKRKMAPHWATLFAPLLGVPKIAFFEEIGVPIPEMPASNATETPHDIEGQLVISVDELDVRAMGGDGATDPELDGEGQHPVLAIWQFPADYLRAHSPSPAAIRIIRVVGDSMEPEFPAQDRVLVDTSHRNPSPPGVYVVHDGYALLLKRLEILIGSPPPPRVRVSSANPAYPPYECPLADLRVQGRVVAKWQWK